jgi:hypothetical protein
MERIKNAVTGILGPHRQSMLRESRPAEATRGTTFCDQWETRVDHGVPAAAAEPEDSGDPENPLWRYFHCHTEGPGIHKWIHYFEIYHRHLAKFMGKPVHLVEIGVQSGGSLEMWREYLGPGCRITGIDIDEECRKFEGPATAILIGDQADRSFWGAFKERFPPVDVVIDDGGHRPEQQMVTLEEMLPHVAPGGVYLCEDVHGVGNTFTGFVYSLVGRLNSWVPHPSPREGDGLSVLPTPIQASLHSLHFYPYVMVIERNAREVARFAAPTRGSEWIAYK